jgi:cyclophilin family peptidyl-prolyl cis-trans isomerase
MRRVLPLLALLPLLVACEGILDMDDEKALKIAVEPERLTWTIGKKMEVEVIVASVAMPPIKVYWPENYDGGLEIGTDKYADPDILVASTDKDFPDEKVLNPDDLVKEKHDITAILEEHLEKKDQIVYIRWRIGVKVSEYYPLTVIHDYTAEVETNLGSFTIDFCLSDAPNTIMAFVKRAKEGFYDGNPVTRVQKGHRFVFGDPGVEDLEPLVRETSHTFEGFGAVAMYYDLKPASATHMIQIRFKERKMPSPSLAVFGKVTAGEETLKKIEAVSVDESYAPAESVMINKITVKVRGKEEEKEGEKEEEEEPKKEENEE